MGVGAMTDFGPLIANPKSFLLGAAAQFGIFAAYFGAIALGFNDRAAAAISIIGVADGPTSIFQMCIRDSPRTCGSACSRTCGGSRSGTCPRSCSSSLMNSRKHPRGSRCGR